MADIILCEFCGEKMSKKGKYCNFCSTSDKRKEQVKKQLEIDKENKAKGRKISDTLFGYPRHLILAKLGLKEV